MQGYDQEAYVIDCETIGLHGFITLVQYALGDGPIVLFCPWVNPVKETIALFEKFCSNPGGCVFFNAAFDFFHIYKMYCTFKMLEVVVGPDELPEDHIDLIIDLEEKARDYPDCLKPVKVLDLFLHARKTEFQSTMERADIKIRRVPSQIAWMVADELEKRMPFKEIYFARRKDKNLPKWQVQDRRDAFGDIDPEWKDIVVRFRASSALKALAVEIGLAKQDDVLKYGDISPKLYPIEFGYAPYAKAAMKIKLRNKIKEGKRKGYKYRWTWPDLLDRHIAHWQFNKLARQYAEDDITYTRGLLKYFNYPAMGDDDSELACMVACARWRGYRVDLDGIKELRQKALDKRFIEIKGEKLPLPTAPRATKAYIMEVCDDIEKLAFTNESGNSTKKRALEDLVKNNKGLWALPCPECTDETGLPKPEYVDGKLYCKRCKNERKIPHPAAVRANEILEARKATKEIELYDKLLAAGRLHASFKVIGTLSSRMSGADGLNAQAIKKTRTVKSRFLLAWPGDILAGSDFESFEITIAVAIYNDPDLIKDLLTCEKCSGQMIFNQQKIDYLCEKCGSNKGKKLHALFGTFVYPGMTYEDIKATDGTENDIYTKCKQAVFAMLYGGEAHTLRERLGVLIEVAEEAHRKFVRKYKGIGREQQKYNDMFSSMRQPEGRGKKVEWHEPAEKIETLYGFPRYFTLENQITKVLYELANNMPKAMKEVKGKVRRTDREQFVPGAAMSAIFSAAFALQSFNKRAATNHVIQGTGAQMTKKVQRKIWDVQPAGVHKWLVQPLNIHDSIMNPTHPSVVDKVAKVVYETVESMRPTVPLVKFAWESYLTDWSDKFKGVAAYNLETGEIVEAYKNRFDVTKFGYDFNEVYKCLTKQTKEYRGLGWRLLIHDEKIDETKECQAKGLFKKPAKVG